MKWGEVQRAHPEAWLVVEALESHHDGERHVIDEVAVVETCLDGMSALSAYRRLRLQNRNREFLFIHTSRADLSFEERRWVGIRAGR